VNAFELRELAAQIMREPPPRFNGDLRCKLLISPSEVGLFLRQRIDHDVKWCLIHKCPRLYSVSEYIDACDMKYDNQVVYPQLINFSSEAEKHQLLDDHIEVDYCMSVLDELYEIINNRLSCFEYFTFEENQKIYNKFYSVKNGFIMRDFEPLNAVELAVLSNEFNGFGIENINLINGL
jgi:hypothetical protein